MAGHIRKDWLLLGLLVMILVILAYAWSNGGREPVHAISEPLPVPGAAR